MYAAIDLLADKLDRRVLKHKEIKADHHARDARKTNGRESTSRAMRLILVSGLSGSGKSVALHMLEDAGFYCVDNIPAALLKPFISHTLRNNEAQYSRAAVGVDARNATAEIETVPPLIEELKKSGIQCEIVFLLADDEELLRRFAETRRKHR